MISALSDWLIAHVGENRMTYLILGAALVGAGAAGQTWIDGRVHAIVKHEAEDIRNDFERKFANIDSDLSVIKEGILRQEIIDAATRLCKNPGDRYLIENLEKAKRRYFQLVGTTYPVPPCKSLVGDVDG